MCCATTGWCRRLVALMSLFGLPVVTDTGGCAKPFQVGVVFAGSGAGHG